MSFPNVNIQLASGQLGAVGAPSTAIPAMIVTGIGTVDIPLATPKVIYQLSDAEALGITESTHPFAHKQIREFYSGYASVSGSAKCALYIMLAVNTVTLCDMVDITKDYAPALLKYAQGSVRLLGVARNAPAVYEPVLTDGIDKDSLDALALAQTLGNVWAQTEQAPIRTLIEGRAFEVDNLGDLADLKQRTSNRAGIVLWGTSGDGVSSVGYTLGVKAALLFVRKISRVANGAHSFTGGVFVGDTALEDVSGLETIHDKGYITMRTFPTRDGYYFAGENMAVADTDDYAILSRGLVIDEAQRIAYNTLLDELEKDVEVGADGQLLPGYVAYVEQRVVNAISMGLADQISGVRFSIPDGQNILSNNTTDCELGIVPLGYQTYINLKLGFVNPALG
jgi:hypothetical protein